MRVTRRQALKGAAALAIAPLEDGATIEINGLSFVLRDVVTPRLFEPNGEFARAVAERLVGEVEMVAAPRRLDRWGRAEGPLWARYRNGVVSSIEAMLITAGAARVVPQSDDRQMIAALLSGEARARKARRGGWSHPAWRVRNANEEVEPAFGFQIYEGAVREARRVKSRIYVNFGDDWRSDVTASARWGEFRRWRPKRAPEDLSGARVRVRGLVSRYNGPSIEIEHPDAIEIIKPRP
jgi:hypothetical protein